MFYCSCCYWQDIAVNKTWQWSKPSFRVIFIDWQVLSAREHREDKQRIMGGRGACALGIVGFFYYHYSWLLSLSQIMADLTQVPQERERQDKEPALCTPGTKQLWRIVFSRQHGRLYAGDTRSHGCVSDPASKISPLAWERCSAKQCTPTKYSEWASLSVSYDYCCRKMNLLQYNMHQG